MSRNRGLKMRRGVGHWRLVLGVMGHLWPSNTTETDFCRATHLGVRRPLPKKKYRSRVLKTKVFQCTRIEDRVWEQRSTFGRPMLPNMVPFGRFHIWASRSTEIETLQRAPTIFTSKDSRDLHPRCGIRSPALVPLFHYDLTLHLRKNGAETTRRGTFLRFFAIFVGKRHVRTKSKNRVF